MSDSKLWDYHQNENRNHLCSSYPRQNMLFRKICKKLDRNSKILEIGFWDGYLLNKLSKNWYDVIWQDLSEININNTKAQRNNNKIKFILWDDSWEIFTLENSLDWFIASEVLEHMSDKELQICVDEIYKKLKVWWYAFLTFPANENLELNQCICPECWKIFHKWWHKQYRDTQKIKRTFKNFKIVTLRTFVSRPAWSTFLQGIIWYLKFIWSRILNINKSYLVILKK